MTTQKEEITNAQKLTKNATESPKLSLHSCYTQTTRLALSEFNLYLPKYRSKKITKSFNYQEAKIWNSVPHELKELPFDQFKSKYKKYLSLNYK